MISIDNILEKIFNEASDSMVFSFADLAVKLKFNKYNTKWLEEYFDHFYKIKEKGSPQWIVSLQQDKKLFKEVDKLKKGFVSDGGYRLFRQELDESRHKFSNFIFINPQAKRLLIVADSYSAELDYQVARNIRTLINLESICRGDLHLHASAVSVGDEAIIFLGDKFQGKTTAWLSLCHYPQIGFISNDHVIIEKSRERVFGVPTSIGIREKTLSYFPKLKDFLMNKKPYYIFQDSPSNKDKKVYFLVKELLRNIGVAIRSAKKVKVLILPTYNRNLDFVRTSLLGVEDLNIKELIINDPCEHAPYWYKLFKSSLVDKSNFSRLKNFLQKNNIKIYRLEYNEKLFEDFYQEINRLLGSVDDEYIFSKARRVSDEYLGNCKRKDNKSMISHLERVVDILKSAKFNSNYLFTLAFLHDILEESDMDKDFLLNNFGKKIRDDVVSLTIHEKEKESFEGEMERMHKKLLSASNEALFVKMADRVHNINNMHESRDYFKSVKIERYENATREMLEKIFIPRLGLNQISNELNKLLN